MNVLDQLNQLNLHLENLILILLPLELFRRWRKGQLNRPCVQEMLASVSPLIPTLLLDGAYTAYMTLAFMACYQLAPIHIPTTLFTVIPAFLLVDLLSYIEHRFAHEVRLYWAMAHSVHHSSPQYDQTIGLRISFVDGFTAPIFYLPAFLIGFDPLLIVSLITFVLVYQQWIHTETVGRLPWLDPWLNTPSNHRVHHGVQTQYLDKNFGAVLIIWDRLFGTYEREEETVIYGLTHPIQSVNPWVVHTFEASRLWQDIQQATRWQDRIQYLFRHPGWQPAPAIDPQLGRQPAN
ncbi:sterol desaturase/sphingolipid hydroxylase (fatty acid hydroxylase superfamily) [Chitinivorax tropicus]|uniref:Sterol desaturase/sphingolipid hydroxylase (Fatty acid hydroxylase superfamily) n=1 Tax=Chitinivorax tropicus TaxID=714531 RepID=A0A840MNF2_9PROT|nr:sterol desaturase family protein [Chitinivorax tropicus]MBB5016771.1 sterol desaturase/sphingolipid hydroxylase (fatty acid hydroxylase superfamily) [Chitinivorax tropicus]